MADDTRNRDNIAFARRIGKKYAGRLAILSFLDVFRRTFARQLLSKLVDEVNRDLGPPEYDRFVERAQPRDTRLNASASIDLTAHIADALRLIRFSRQIGLDGVLVWIAHRESDDSFIEPALFDLFNPLARRMLRGRDDQGDHIGHSSDRSAIRSWVQITAREFSVQVAIVPSVVASRGFLALFTDSLRSIVRSQRNANTSYVDYTVHSRGSGYQLEYYPQFNATPLVFGGTLTTPVSQRILIGRYCFQGW